MSEAPSDPVAAAAWLNDQVTGWNAAMNLRFTRASGDEVVAELTVAPQHLQPFGIVHGGLHAGVIEAACSTGAALWAMPMGLTVVGLENSTSFLRALRTGRLTVTATPLTRGRRSQVWAADVRGDDGKLAAQGKVRLMCLEPGTMLAGERTRDQPTP